MFGTELDGAILEGADFSDVRCAGSRFCNLDLSEVKGLASVRHSMPSSIGVETLVMSGGKIPRAFLLGVGVPKTILEYIVSASTAPLQFYSCFVSYCTKDEFFARRLHHDLLVRDIRCWLFEEDAKWGEKVWSEIDRSIKIHDKTIVICSAHSLQSPPVLREIERAIQREDVERRDVLFPVRIDDYIFTAWDHPRKADVISKVIGDFRDPAQYETSVLKLVG
ncbi:MAG: toll/interleukin-1 receptor domain-containing protein, partial [Candidatus Sulfotelmatobacter sp.]